MESPIQFVASQHIKMNLNAKKGNKMVVRIGTNNTRVSFKMVLCFDLQSALICGWENAMLMCQ